jgi:hypothetical protein
VWWVGGVFGVGGWCFVCCFGGFFGCCCGVVVGGGWVLGGWGFWGVGFFLGCFLVCVGVVGFFWGGCFGVVLGLWFGVGVLFVGVFFFVVVFFGVFAFVWWLYRFAFGFVLNKESAERSSRPILSEILKTMRESVIVIGKIRVFWLPIRRLIMLSVEETARSKINA